MGSMSILEQLKSEHDVLKKLLSVALDSHHDERSSILQLIKEDIIPHARGEEKTIYSLLKERLDDQHASAEDINQTNEAYEEHRVIDNLLQEIEMIATNDDKWMAHFRVLKENIEHHIEEEEDKLFGLIKKQFSKDMLMDLKEVYMNEKEKFMNNLPSQSQINERDPSSDAQVIS